ncbi:MAG: response regulator [Acidobacteriota bacterium]
MSPRSAVIIDDEPDITAYLSTLLSDHGWEVRAANSVEAGLGLLKGRRPDVVLLDLMMPERGGLNALVAIRKDTALEGLPVLIVSGIQEKLTSDYHAYLERFKHYRPDGYLDKPVKPEELFTKLDELTLAKA